MDTRLFRMIAELPSIEGEVSPDEVTLIVSGKTYKKEFRYGDQSTCRQCGRSFEMGHTEVINPSIGNLTIFNPMLHDILHHNAPVKPSLMEKLKRIMDLQAGIMIPSRSS